MADKMKNRIVVSERVEWTTNLGNTHAGEVLAFVPAGDLVTKYLPAATRKRDCKWEPVQDISPQHRYLIKNEEATLASHDAPLTDRRIIYRVANATLIEKQNTAAKRSGC